MSKPVAVCVSGHFLCTGTQCLSWAAAACHLCMQGREGVRAGQTSHAAQQGSGDCGIFPRLQQQVGRHHVRLWYVPKPSERRVPIQAQHRLARLKAAIGLRHMKAVSWWPHLYALPLFFKAHPLTAPLLLHLLWLGHQGVAHGLQACKTWVPAVVVVVVLRVQNRCHPKQLMA